MFLKASSSPTVVWSWGSCHYLVSLNSYHGSIGPVPALVAGANLHWPCGGIRSKKWLEFIEKHCCLTHPLPGSNLSSSTSHWNVHSLKNLDPVGPLPSCLCEDWWCGHWVRTLCKSTNKAIHNLMSKTWGASVFISKIQAWHLPFYFGSNAVHLKLHTRQ